MSIARILRRLRGRKIDSCICFLKFKYLILRESSHRHLGQLRIRDTDRGQVRVEEGVAIAGNVDPGLHHFGRRSLRGDQSHACEDVPCGRRGGDAVPLTML